MAFEKSKSRIPEEDSIGDDSLPLYPEWPCCSSYSNGSSSRPLLSPSSTSDTSSSSRSRGSSDFSFSQRSHNSSSYNSLSFSFNDEEEIEIEQWREISRLLQFNDTDNNCPLNRRLWRRLAISMYNKIEAWKQETIDSYTPSVYEFCIVHTENEIDRDIATKFLQLLSLADLRGISVCDLDAGSERFADSEKILKGSSKVFVLNSPPFVQSGFHKIIYQESMMKRLYSEDWRKKIIPLHPCKQDVAKYSSIFSLQSLNNYSTNGCWLFGLSSTIGIALGNDEETMRQVRKTVLPSMQKSNATRRKSEVDKFCYATECIKKSKCKELGQGLTELKEEFRRHNLSTEKLALICMDCENITTLPASDSPEQVIRLEQCKEVSIGPSFHFNICPQSTEFP